MLKGSWVLVSDAVKKALPENVPMPAAVKAPVADEAPVAEAPAEETAAPAEASEE